LIDKSLEKFAQDVGIKLQKPEVIGEPLLSVRSPFSLAKAVLSENPKKALTKMVLKKGIGALANQTFDSDVKIASESGRELGAPVDVLSVYEKLTDKYGEAWRDWEIETIATTIRQDHGVTLGDHAVEVIGALQAIVKTNMPFEDWHVFEKVVHALNGNIVDFTQVQQCEMDDIAYTLKVMNALRPWGSEDVFSEEVENYIACCAKVSGVVFLPQDLFSVSLDVVQDNLDRLGNDMELRFLTERAWPRKPDLKSANLALEVQLAKLHEIADYMR
jgi:hypothetical protein